MSTKTTKSRVANIKQLGFELTIVVTHFAVRQIFGSMARARGSPSLDVIARTEDHRMAARGTKSHCQDIRTGRLRFSGDGVYRSRAEFSELLAWLIDRRQRLRV